MVMQRYSTTPSRNLLRAEYRMLKHAMPIQVLTKFGVHKEQPLRVTDTVVFRRVKPFNADSSEVPDITPGNFLISEGTIPNAHGIDYTDVTTTLLQYGVLFKFSSKTELMYEDDVPKDMAEQTGETIMEIAELVMYGQVKAGTNVLYTNGSTRAGLNTTIGLLDLRQVARAIENNRGKLVTKAGRSDENFGTVAVEAAYLVFCPTDMKSDCRDIPGFTRRVDYGGAIKPVHDREFGAVEDFRFIASPLFKPWLAGGAVIGTSGMVSAAGVNCDVYPLIVTAADAWGDVSLKGHGHTGISPTILPSNKKSHANPLGTFGYVGADFWMSCVRLNENWMYRIETCATKLNDSA